jgi:hypothetical protein
LRCAARSAFSTPSPILADRTGGNGPVAASRSCSERDGTYSMTIHGSASGTQNVEDADDVDVVEPGDRAGLAKRPFPHLLPLLGVRPGGGTEFLDGDVTMQHDVGRPPDTTHPALTERRDKPVAVSDNERGGSRHHAENTRSCRRPAN